MTAVTDSALLQEDGFVLLQEDEFSILLEPEVVPVAVTLIATAVAAVGDAGLVNASCISPGSGVLLQEDGFALLQEDGFYILTEPPVSSVTVLVTSVYAIGYASVSSVLVWSEVITSQTAGWSPVSVTGATGNWVEINT
jgi:hypothetical protein